MNKIKNGQVVHVTDLIMGDTLFVRYTVNSDNYYQTVEMINKSR